jgi:hypothetical protein
MADFFSFYNRLNEKKELDPVKDKALDKKFKNRKDKDIDNDGDVDSSDEYLHKRRKKIDKAMDEGSCSKKRVSEATAKELKKLDLGDDVMVNGKMGMFYGMEGRNLVKVRTKEGTNLYDVKDVEIMNLMMDELEKDEDDPCWDGYVQVGTKMKNGKEVPKCVPMEEAKNYMKEEVSKLLGEAYDYPDYGPTGAVEMAMTQLHFIQYAAEEVIECLKAGTEMPEWYQNKIAKVEGDMEGIHSYMEGKRRKREMCGPETMGMDDYDYDMDMDMDMDTDADMDMDMDDDEDMMDMGMYEQTGDLYQMFKDMMDNPSKDIKRLDMKKKPQEVRVIDLKDRGGEEELDTKGLKASDGFAIQIRPKGSSRGRQFKTIFTVKDKKEAEKARKKIESGFGYQMRMFESKQISEKLSATDDISDWIKDFKDSDAEQFKGKSAEERKDMAIAAYYDARREAGYKTPQQKDD